MKHRHAIHRHKPNHFWVEVPFWPTNEKVPLANQRSLASLTRCAAAARLVSSKPTARAVSTNVTTHIHAVRTLDRSDSERRGGSRRRTRCAALSSLREGSHTELVRLGQLRCRYVREDRHQQNRRSKNPRSHWSSGLRGCGRESGRARTSAFCLAYASAHLPGATHT